MIAMIRAVMMIWIRKIRVGDDDFEEAKKIKDIIKIILVGFSFKEISNPFDQWASV
jgi:hypothetical protein